MLKHLIALFFCIAVSTTMYAEPFFNTTIQCAGSQSSFSLSSTTNIDSVKWDFGNGISSDILITAPFAATCQYNSLGSYQLTITYYSSGIPQQKDTTIVVPGAPAPYLYDFNQCYQQITYNAASIGASYVWSNGATTPTIDITTSGTYWVNVTNGCGTGTDTAIVSFIFPPILSIPSQIELCGDTVANIIAGPSTNNYLWQDGSTSNSFTVSAPTQLFVFESNQCGSVYEYSNIVYYEVPFLNLGPDTTLCNQSSYELKANFTPATTIWYDGSDDTLKLITQPGTYYCKVSNFCKVLNDTVIIDFQNTPNLDLGNDTLICGGEYVAWDVYNYGAVYNWNTGADVPWSNTYLPGTFWVSLENACGFATDTIDVKMRFIYVDIPVSDTSICINDFYPVNVAVDSATNYLWSDGNTNSYRDLDKPGNYIVQVSNECGIVEDTINISMYDCNNCAKFPTGFTPNNDGKNDIFRVRTDCDIRDYNLYIFNRAGNMIFTSDEIDAGWDGTYDGVNQPVGAYVYRVTYNFWDGNSLVEANTQGTITLIR
jgi:gliding motility-associated-like protein